MNSEKLSMERDPLIERDEKQLTLSSGNERGFSLLETAIASVLLMIVGLGVAGLFVYAVGSNSGSSDRAAALTIAQAEMEKLRATPFTDAALLSTGATSITRTIIDGSGRSFQVSTAVADSLVVNTKITLKKITIRVTPLSSRSPQTVATNIFGSVTLVAERSNPVAGTNIH
jgi:Tfp pilus assembly protein PilV